MTDRTLPSVGLPPTEVLVNRARAALLQGKADGLLRTGGVFDPTKEEEMARLEAVFAPDPAPQPHPANRRLTHFLIWIRDGYLRYVPLLVPETQVLPMVLALALRDLGLDAATRYTYTEGMVGNPRGAGLDADPETGEE